MAPHMSRWLISLGKIALVPVLLWITIKNGYGVPLLNFEGMDLVLAVSALVLNQAALLVFAVRMRTVLAVFGIRISGVAAQRIHLQSIFYYFALPMTIGLEVARYAKIRRIVDKEIPRLRIGGALIVDRVIGALSALAISLVLAPFALSSSAHLTNGASALVPIGGVASIFSMIAIWIFRRQIYQQLLRLFEFSKMATLPMLAVFALSLLTHLLFAGAVYAGVQSCSINITFGDTLFVVATAMLMVAIPASFAGISPVEAAAFGLMLIMGFTNDQAMTYVLLSYFLKLFAAIQGGLLEFLDGGRDLIALQEAKK